MKSIYQEVLLAAAEEILLLVEPDNLAILAANPAACSMLGYPSDVLLSGNFAEIEKWQDEQAYERTRRLRPDLLDE